MEKLAERIKSHEGYRDRLYLDSEGNLTGGWGHHFYLGSRLPVDAAEILFKMDLAAAVTDYQRILPSLRKKLNVERARVVVEMIFNMGLQKVIGFKKFWDAVDAEDWNWARGELLDSRWHLQVGKRAEDLADIFEKGG